MSNITPDMIRDVEIYGTPDEWAKLIDLWASEKGWNDVQRTEAEWAALAHTEISEAFEAYRDNMPAVWIKADSKPEGIAIEYADCVIRIMHWFAQHNLSLSQTLATKMLYNITREYRHGGKQA